MAGYTAEWSDAKDWIDGGGEFLPPRAILEDLTPEQATHKEANWPHSIAQIVAHMNYYQGARFAKLRGEEWPEAAHLEDTFAPVSVDGWVGLRDRFLADLESIKAYADRGEEYAYVSRALHNGYHLGQVVTLRQLIGAWPPASGEPYDF